MILAIPLVIVAMYFATTGAAYVSGMTAKAHVGFLGQLFNLTTLPAQVLIRAGVALAKWITHQLEPAYLTAESHIAGFIARTHLTLGWNASFSHRNAVALHNTASWADTELRAEITAQAVAQAETFAKTKGRSLAPSPTLARATAKQNAVAFRHALDNAFPGELVKTYPEVNWTSRKWRAFLGVLPAVGGIALPFPRVIPRTIPIPKQGKINSQTNRRLKRIEKILGISGLAGLITATFGREITRFLRCPNTRGIAKSWCGADLNALLGLLIGVAEIEAGFSLVDFADTLIAAQNDVVNVILSGISEFDGVTV